MRIDKISCNSFKTMIAEQAGTPCGMSALLDRVDELNTQTATAR